MPVSEQNASPWSKVGRIPAQPTICRGLAHVDGDLDGGLARRDHMGGSHMQRGQCLEAAVGLDLVPRKMT